MEQTSSEDTPGETTSPAGSDAGGARDRLRVARGSWSAAKSRIARVKDDVRIEARSTAYAAQRYARERPWRVAGAAAVLALLVGYVIGSQLAAAHLRRRLRR